MFPIRKRKNYPFFNFDGLWEPISDSSFTNELYITKYKFIDFHADLLVKDEEAFKTMQRVKNFFTQFQDKLN